MAARYGVIWTNSQKNITALMTNYISMKVNQQQQDLNPQPLSL